MSILRLYQALAPPPLGFNPGYYLILNAACTELYCPAKPCNIDENIIALFLEIYIHTTGGAIT